MSSYGMVITNSAGKILVDGKHRNLKFHATVDITTSAPTSTSDGDIWRGEVAIPPTSRQVMLTYAVISGTAQWVGYAKSDGATTSIIAESRTLNSVVRVWVYEL